MAMRKNNRKWLWWGIGILVVAVIATTIVMVKKNILDKTSQNEQNQSEVKPAEEDKSKEEKEKDMEPEVASTAQKEEVKQYDGDDPNKAEELTGVISYVGVSGGSLIVRVNIDQFLAGGSCKMALVKDGNIIYNKTAVIVSSVSTSTCDGFTVPVSEISGKDKLTLEVTLESDNKYGKMVGEVTI